MKITKQEKYHRKYRKKNPQKIRLRNKVFRTKNPSYKRTDALKRNYGITPEDFNRMSREQGGVCAICKRAPKGRGLDVDHNHATDKVRALLCNTCNMALGLLQDSAIFARAAADYLEKHN